MNICLACKGRGWCHRKCAPLEKLKSLMQVSKNLSNDITGSSPPGVFVGRSGYPNINVGVLLPNYTGDTKILDSPETWYEEKADISRVIAYRSQLVNSSFVSNIKKANQLLEATREIAMSSSPVETEVHLKEKPFVKIVYDNSYPPMGPKGNLLKMNINENPHVPRKIEYVASDTDLKAEEAVLELYFNKFTNSQIMKVFSLGLLGIKTQRRLVPTRWAITAIDDITGKNLIKRIKHYEHIDSIKIFFGQHLGNKYTVLFIPRVWSFELLELWYPEGVWTKDTKIPQITSDCENQFGRKTYADNTAGAYYAIRLAVLEHLEKIKKQASVLVFREITKDYYAPLGVWVTREGARGTLRNPLLPKDLNTALSYIPKEVVAQSKLMKEIKIQRTLK